MIKNLGVVHKPSSEEQASIMQAVMVGPMLDADKRFAELQRGPSYFVFVLGALVGQVFDLGPQWASFCICI